MRSPIGPILILLGLGTAVVLVLLLVQTMGMRAELERARADLAAVQAQVEAQEDPMTTADLTRGLDDLESSMRDWLIATGADGGFEGDPSQPAGGSGSGDSSGDEVLERLDEVLERITALDQRVDEICDGVPVC
jgi:hypothetical protein